MLLNSKIGNFDLSTAEPNQVANALVKLSLIPFLIQ
jgi:hypothetical protein